MVGYDFTIPLALVLPVIWIPHLATNNRHLEMHHAIAAGSTYFTIAFLFGFAFGAIRSTWIAPLVGKLSAVAIELPLMLIVSRLACGWCLQRFSIERLPARVTTGLVAFALLMLAEASLSIFAFGQSLTAHLTGYLSPPEALGLLGQICFGAMPLVLLRSTRPAHL